MSMNMFLENESDPVVWRGPMVSSAIKQFYSDVDWEELDYLLVDLPPGTSDAPMTVLQSLPVDGVVIVSSPQMLATMVVKKCINMVRQLKGIIVGVVENMSYFETPDGERYEIFGPGNGLSRSEPSGRSQDDAWGSFAARPGLRASSQRYVFCGISAAGRKRHAAAGGLGEW